ncbi:sensor histidine kinase [Paenibacillus sp. GCM10027626]|uniref:sensor histidine kinase n=1 Tax=Paenibacillus sp. GCM10027626 TaxID=3273411 RepID=UPI0036258755
MLSVLYNRFLKQKFFNRLLLSYTLILLVTIGFLSSTIIRSVDRSAERDAVDSANQAVQRIRSYFDQKENTVKLLVQQLYLNPYQSRDMMEFLSQDTVSYNSDDLSKADMIKYYLSAAVYQDRDIMDAVIYKKVNGSLYVRSSDFTLNNDEYLNTNIGLFNAMDDQFHGLALTAAYSQTYNTNNRKAIFTIAANLRGDMKNNIFDKSIAVLSVNFNTDRMIRLFQDQIDRNYNIDILVLTRDGQVICDTRNMYYGKPYPFFDQVKATNQKANLDRSSMVTTSASDSLGFYVVGILPHSDISSKTRSTKNTVIALAAGSALVAIVLGFVSIRFFSSRIRLINKAIQNVQTGDFTSRVSVGRTNDEIGMIAVNFNEMCNQIVDYINKVYISELKQKEAELYALQSQIDPHFLYNTLEAIHMEALAAGNEQVSQMIEILAQLFRSSIKEGMFITIREELHYCSLYLDLYNIRYEDNLTIGFRIDPDIYEFGIPKYLLQPIVENCVIHGFRHNGEDNRIMLHGYLSKTGIHHADDIFIEVIDNGNGMNPIELEKIKNELNVLQFNSNHRSIGIANVHQRIRLAFGLPYGIDIVSSENEGTRIVIRLPARSKGEMAEYVQSTHRR